MQKILNNVIDGKHQKPILYDLFFEQTKIKKPIVIFCHGFKGYKDWGSWNIMGNYFAKHGFFFIKFSFAFSGGTIENPIDYPDIDAFSQNNFTKELDDLDVILNYLQDNPYLEEMDLTNISVIGHSRGGGIATLKAGEDKRIAKLVSWCGISDIEGRFPKGEQLTYWKKEQIVYTENRRTLQQMPMHYQVYEDFMTNKERFNIKNAILNLEIPHLLVSGSKDDVVLPIEAENQHKWNPKSELFTVENMDHGLGNTQPWHKEDMPKHMKIVVDETIRFLKKC